MPFHTNSDDARRTCAINAEVALKFKRRKLALVWRMCLQVAHLAHQMAPLTNFQQFWACHPCGGKLLSQLVQYQIGKRDYQTAAMIVCAFTPHTESRHLPDLPISINNTYSTSGSSIRADQEPLSAAPYKSAHKTGTIRLKVSEIEVYLFATPT